MRTMITPDQLDRSTTTSVALPDPVGLPWTGADRRLTDMHGHFIEEIVDRVDRPRPDRLEKRGDADMGCMERSTQARLWPNSGVSPEHNPLQERNMNVFGSALAK